ncbi:thiolase family protein [Aeromicrobium sp. Leaf350]|uniref:thiolase family protein n=1 Tax=Aeromicrobium sp. Leaf350 TaxID=2876565 RepID=UPI001E33E7DD|nr:thiolase family protein [Aeromicrobium sp. Leaf350]
MENAVIVDAVRTAAGRGKPGGALSDVHPVDLLAETLRSLIERTGIDPALVDDVIGGCVQQVGDQSGNIAHTAWLAAGYPHTVPGTTVNRQCGSSQQAASFGAQGVMAGSYDIVIACGVESMSRVPLLAARKGAVGSSDLLQKRYPEGLVNQGVAAELIAARYKFSRHQLDDYSFRSHQRAAEAANAGSFENEIFSVETPGGRVSADETIRSATTIEGLSGLKPSFQDEAISQRFPEIEWKITPGNSSPLTDGASAVLIMSELKAKELGLKPRARFHAFSVVGDDPLYMLTGPIPATRKVLDRAGMKIADLDVYEVNEAFAPVPLAWATELEADLEKLNPRGGAISLGHALGASGTRILTTLLNTLESTGGRYGLQTMCEAGGLANATVIEAL